jgi:hypothetical protein
MKSNWNIGRLRRGRFLKATVLLLLLHTGVELVFCQVSGENFGVPIGHASATSTQPNAKVDFAVVLTSISEKSEKEQRSDPQFSDENCLGCCTQVMPSPIFASSANAELKLKTSLAESISTPPPPLHSPYHPPRFA